ncbi:hypothetical protein WPS_27780 [Vulcanimicrobium alpinum]|uniref:Uncharacterized protein n=1 Tax=Vulcanimicrobium alpinum TaxID=3016050 RepID=A0AAN1XY22_UNVUL|nr:hypothetical protein [Vulcanimicrobium alpinum]BDE07502.1 hypothetical protein WPS_27780 [Vulcanimicrobium alpinum]
MELPRSLSAARRKTKPTGLGTIFPTAENRERAAGSKTNTACCGKSCRRRCPTLLGADDDAKADAVMQAMLATKKLDIAALQEAYDRA